MSLKLDMSKAYDHVEWCYYQVEWCYLEWVMLKLGLIQKIVSLTMTCMSTPTFSILIN